MKTIRQLIYLIGFSMVYLACSPGNFGDINVNPNALETPIPSALLTNALIIAANNTQDMNCGLYCQFFSQSQYTDESRYTLYDRPWANQYAGPLYDLQLIIQLNSDPEKSANFIQYGSNANQIAVARILMVYYYFKLTDLYGDIPYFEALKLQSSIPYDSQEEIYKDLLTTLKGVILQFDNGLGPTGDILFNGNVIKWKKFANSLRLILALRMAKAAPSLAKTEFYMALNDPAGSIESNVDNAIQIFLGGTYRNPWFNLYNGNKSYGVSATLVDTLISLNDPRLYVFGNPNSMGKVIGIPYGIERDSAIKFINAHPDWSFILKSNLRASNSSVYHLTAANVLLARAEAAYLGWTNEDAMNLYAEGIRASFEQWNVYNTASFNAYLAEDRVILTSDTLKKIQLQRYLSYYPDGLQAFSEWRRNSVPNLQPTPFAVNPSHQIPRRFPYPVSEQNLNAKAWQEAVARMGGTDDPESHVWWDK